MLREQPYIEADHRSYRIPGQPHQWLALIANASGLSLQACHRDRGQLPLSSVLFQLLSALFPSEAWLPYGFQDVSTVMRLADHFTSKTCSLCPSKLDINENLQRKTITDAGIQRQIWVVVPCCINLLSPLPVAPLLTWFLFQPCVQL